MDFLCLPEWLTLQTEETDQDYLVEALPLSRPADCPACGSDPQALQRFGRQRHVVRDAPVRGKRVRIYFNAQRFRCSTCGRFSQQPLPGVDERRRATERLIRYVERESLKRPFLAVAEEVGLSPNTVRSIFTDFAERCAGTIRFETPRRLGIDEVYVARTARCILTDLCERRVVELLPKRDIVTVSRYLVQMPDKERVEVVAMDMWRPYHTAVRKMLPRAEVVIDTYHVQRMANQAVMAVLRRIRRGLNSKDRRERMFDRFVLLTRGYRLTPAQKKTLGKWKEKNPEAGLAYELKEEFLDLWNLSERAVAEARYRRWSAKIPHGLEYAFGEITTAVKNWGREIFNYFDHRVTNAFTESANNVVKAMQRQGRTYSYEIIRAKLLYGGGISKRRDTAPGEAKEETVAGDVARRRRARRAPSPHSPASVVRRLRIAREAQDQLAKLLREEGRWHERFKDHLAG